MAYAVYNLGVELAEEGDRRIAAMVFSEARETDHREIAPRAAFHLAVLSETTEGAIAHYRDAVAFDHPEVSAKAAFNLGKLLASTGELDAAREAFARALEGRDADVRARASLELAWLPGAVDEVTADAGRALVSIVEQELARLLAG